MVKSNEFSMDDCEIIKTYIASIPESCEKDKIVVANYFRTAVEIIDEFAPFFISDTNVYYKAVMDMYNQLRKQESARIQSNLIGLEYQKKLIVEKSGSDLPPIIN